LGTAAGESPLSAASELITGEYREEMESLAAGLEFPFHDLVLCNLYYDSLKTVLGPVFGCTAFAIDTGDGVLHARNLDWWTEGSLLSRYTTVCQFVGGPAGEFTTVGWPGFVGAFSGIAPGRFAVTLNAVLSDEPAQVGTPMVLLIRKVLEEARSFTEAVRTLSETPILCDCLLLVTGVVPGEMVVIERTPGRRAVRGARSGFVCVTNAYWALEAGLGTEPSGLLATSCQRFERISELLQRSGPGDAEGCFEYLSDPAIRMNITVQQMVFCAATGELRVRS
jgi:hypothetical protein